MERYLTALNSLIEKDLLAFDGTQLQVLELPEHAPATKALRTAEELEQHDAATINVLARQSLGHRWKEDDAHRET